MTTKGRTISAIVALATTGKTAEQIATEIGITRDAVWKALKRAGLTELKHQLFQRPGRTHGLPSTYSHLGCRCDLCTDVHTAHMEKMRNKRDPTQATHGLSSTFTNYDCRCEPCTKAHQAKVRERMRRNLDTPNTRKQWTGPELEYITAKQPDGRRYLRTAHECAVALGRSVSAVDAQRKLCRIDPRKAVPASMASR